MSTNFYQKDLAFVHDQGYSDLSKAAAKYCLTLLATLDHPDIKVIELGCGSGYFANTLAEQNYSVVGIDYSADLIELARQNAPKAEFVCGSFFDYPIPQCSAIAAIDEIFNYAFDPRNSLENLARFFEHCYQQLLPGGFLLFDVLAPGQLNGASQQNRIVENENWTMYIEYTEDLTKQTYQRDIHLFRQLDNGLYRKSREVHHVRLYEQADLKKILEGLGFEIEVLDRYGSANFEVKQYGILARKPSPS